MLFPTERYRISGYTLRPLVPANKPAMQALREAVMAALPDPRWYFSMTDEEIDQWLAEHGVVGFWADDVLAGFAAITPWHLRDHAYADVLGDPPEHTYDFHDVMVHPAHRGHHMHRQFLGLFEETVRNAGGLAIYATVDPQNSASWHNFERAGYRCVVTQPAYDGRDRRYYKLSL